jgi:dipeptide/tripeptide permease
MFYVCFDQMQNNLISQAKQMQSNNIPNDMVSEPTVDIQVFRHVANFSLSLERCLL